MGFGITCCTHRSTSCIASPTRSFDTVHEESHSSRISGSASKFSPLELARHLHVSDIAPTSKKRGERSHWVLYPISTSSPQEYCISYKTHITQCFDDLIERVMSGIRLTLIMTRRVNLVNNDVFYSLNQRLYAFSLDTNPFSTSS